MTPPRRSRFSASGPCFLASPRPTHRAVAGRWALLSLLSAALLLGACDEKKDGAETTQTSEKTDEPAAEANSEQKIGEALRPQPVALPQPTPPPVPEIELVTPGTGPKKLLRYSFKKGRVKKFVMSMEVVPTMTVDGSPVPGSPPMKFDIKGTSTTLEVEEDGTAVRDTVFTEFTPTMTGVPPQVMQQLTAQMAMFSGMAMTETINSQGEVLAVELKRESVNTPQAQALLQNLQDGMSNAFLPLPDAEVGTGAKWKGTSVVDTAGLPITQVSTFELQKLAGSEATITVTFDQSAKPQELADPRIPPGAKAELLSMKGTGDGKLKVNLATLDTESRVDMSMKVETKISGLPSEDTPASSPAGTPPPAPSGKPGPTKPIHSTTATTMRMEMKLAD